MRLVALTAFCLSVFGQTADNRVYTFKYTVVPQDLNEIGTVIRGVADVKDYHVNVDERTLTVRGTLDQIALASWLFPLLDHPGNEAGPVDPQLGPSEYKMANAPDPDNIVHVFSLSPGLTVQQVQEIATAVRSTTDIRRMFVYVAPRILVTRGTADQTAAAQWMFGQVLKPKGTAAQTYPASGSDVYAVFHLASAKNVQDVQEIATLLRSTGDIMHLFTYNAENAITVRGTADQVALTTFLVDELNKPSHSANSDEYHMASASDNIVRVFYLQNTDTVAAFQQIAGTVRKQAGVRRMFTYNAPRAIAVRGSAAQLNEVAQLLAERSKSN